MRERDVLNDCLRIIEERGEQYGDVHGSFDRAAKIASTIIGRTLTPRDVAMVLLGVKLSRMSHDPMHRDSHVDAANYLAIAFALTEVRQKVTDNAG